MAPQAPRLLSVDEWWPDDRARAKCTRVNGGLQVEANGTGYSCGGWQLAYEVVTPGLPVRLSLRVRHHGALSLRENVLCTVHWGLVDPRSAPRSPVVPWDYMPLSEAGGQGEVFERTLTPPDGCTRFTLRITLRWTSTGRFEVELPGFAEAEPRNARRVNVTVISGSPESRDRLGRSLQENHAVFSELCRSAAVAGSDLLVLPELAAHVGLEGHPFDLASPVPGPVTEQYGQIARANRTFLLVGLYEESGGAVFNSAALLDPGGAVAAVFRKAQLAVSGENENGVRPASILTVADVSFGRVGCVICADVSFQEVTRVASLQGAELVMVPIEGDSRANRRSIGPSLLDEERWRAILRTRAMDNDCVLAVARNAGQGSCIIDADGTVLAYNDGGSDFVSAEVELGRRLPARNGGNQRDIQRFERRLELYEVIPRVR